MKHLYSCSLGKDSVAELIIAKQQGVPIDRVVVVDMQDADFPQMKDYLYNLQNYLGLEFEVVKAPYTFEEKFFQAVKTGKRIREHRGLPLTVGCGCWVKRDLKVDPVERWIKANNLNGYLHHFGFAKGEEHRLARPANAVSLLIENNITEGQARVICEREGLLNPLYQYFDRLGCWFCPKQPLKSWFNLWRHFPDLWQKLKYYERFSYWKLTPNYSTDELEIKFLKEPLLQKKPDIEIRRKNQL